MPNAVYGRALAIYRETSAEAWASVLDVLAEVDQDILNVIHSRGNATCDEIEVETGYKHQTVSAQIRHMCEAGLVIPSDHFRPTRSGRRAIAWRLRPRRTPVL